jgi:DNA polymerase epsilon subunit 1
MPSVNTPGTYASVCIDLDVRNLAINTILTSSLINELEGADSISFNPAADPGEGSEGNEVLFSENAFANAGIIVLREMVKSWWAEACKGSTMADVMVQHLVRWVECPASCLYDRALHYYVQMMSRKALLQLMADFRRVGSQVIYASSNRLLLQTTKSEVGNAYAYAQYILKSIKGKPLFHFIDLEIKEYWDYLVWYDEFNYGGKACQEVLERDEQDLQMIMHWQMATFLPKRLEPVFTDWVVEFIQLMHSIKRPATGSDPTATPRLTQLPIRTNGTQASIGDDPDGHVILGKTFERPLKKEIAALLNTQKRELLHPELAGDYEFPQLPGSYLPYLSSSDPSPERARHDNDSALDPGTAVATKKSSSSRGTANPVLELVKSLMQVLSLDKNIALEARLLRKDLLAMLDVREFGRDATFANPSESLRVEQLSCDSCALARDLDLCRDEALLPDGKGGAARWRCGFCEAEYDRNGLEERILAGVEALVVQWATQDVKCRKCGALRVNEFMEHCTCSGEWGESVRREDVLRRLRVYRNVAKFYGLRMLGDVVEGVFDGL